jgi:hypothetical protein
MLEKAGLQWSLVKGLNRTGRVDLAGFAKKLRGMAEESYDFILRVTDVKGKTAETLLKFAVSEAQVKINAVPDYDMWSTKAYIDITTNVGFVDAFKFEAVDGSSVVATYDAQLIGRTGDVSRFALKGLSPSTVYAIRANYCNGLKYMVYSD